MNKKQKNEDKHKIEDSKKQVKDEKKQNDSDIQIENVEKYNVRILL